MQAVFLLELQIEMQIEMQMRLQIKMQTIASDRLQTANCKLQIDLLVEW